MNLDRINSRMVFFSGIKLFIAFESSKYNVCRHHIVLNSSQGSEHNQNSTDFFAGGVLRYI